MAAVAYDVTALALKGPEATINFPGLAHRYPLPASFSAADIRAAASTAVVAIPPASEREPRSYSSINRDEEFIDEEALFDMPKLQVDMEKGMLVSPLRIKSAAEEEESPENYSKNDRL